MAKEREHWPVHLHLLFAKWAYFKCYIEFRFRVFFLLLSNNSYYFRRFMRSPLKYSIQFDVL